MKTKIRLLFILPALLALSSVNSAISTAMAQGTAFTYQGQLNSGGSAANGFFDFEFSLFNAPISGSQIGSTITQTAIGVTNGLFAATLDFGSVFNGNATWLAISVRSNGVGSFAALSPLQPLLPVPYAVLANSAGNLSGTLPASQLTGAVANSQLANDAITITLGAGLSGGGGVALGGLATLNNTGVLSVAGNGDITAATASGAVTLGSTATSADVVGAIVKRDAGGNFSAGTITLSGGLNMGGAGANTAVGLSALADNTAGYQNAAFGALALQVNTTGNNNTAIGAYAMDGNTNGSQNTAIGEFALFGNTSGSNNIALGFQAGENLTTGSSNIDIGNPGVAGDNNTIRIGSGQSSTFIAGVITAPGFQSDSSGDFAAGTNNIANGGHATVSGGAGNSATGNYATVGGGEDCGASTHYATVAGGYGNTASSLGAVVGGGGYDGTFWNGNTASGRASVVAGGLGNQANNDYSTVAGGRGNTATGVAATVGGGYANTASWGGDFVGGGGYDGQTWNGNSASGGACVVAGGWGNQATAVYATVPGGCENIAGGIFSFAAGQQAQALHRGAFVWADSQEASFSSTANNQFLIRAQGGVGMGTNDPQAQLEVSSSGGVAFPQAQLDQEDMADSARLRFTVGGNVNGRWDVGASATNFEIWSQTWGANMIYLDNRGLTVNGTLVSSSDRNVKAGFEPVDTRSVLEQVAALPITRWHYTNDPATAHLGPVAQDFYAAFSTGADDKHIAVVDEGGVALAAIQGLNRKLEEQAKEKDAEIQDLKQSLVDLKQLVQSLAGKK